MNEIKDGLYVLEVDTDFEGDTWAFHIEKLSPDYIKRKQSITIRRMNIPDDFDSWLIAGFFNSYEEAESYARFISRRKFKRDYDEMAKDIL
jgi:hypothetical protein